MKTITLLLAGLLILGSQTGFADSMDYTVNCCPVTVSSGTVTIVNQQLILDQLQFESENLPAHSAIRVHERVQQKVMQTNEAHASMNGMQQETENITVSALQVLSVKVEKHVARMAETASK